MSSRNDRDLAFPQKVENPFGELKEGAVGCNDVQSVAAVNPNATVVNKAPAASLAYVLNEARDDWENRKIRLKNNREYWIEKIEENIARDRRNDSILQTQGWQVFHFWEKEVLKSLPDCLEKILIKINT